MEPIGDHKAMRYYYIYDRTTTCGVTMVVKQRWLAQSLSNALYWLTGRPHTYGESQ